MEEKISDLTEKHNDFILVMTTWDTEKHDIDLTIKDPQGRQFDFKNRKLKNAPGEFIVDSRTGPGLEAWRSDKIIPGRYSAKFTLYNQYGVKEPTKVQALAVTNNGSFEFPKFELDFEKKRTVIFSFEVDEKGKVTFSSSR